MKMRLLVVIEETTKITSDGNCLFQASIMDYVHTPNTARNKKILELMQLLK